MADTPESAPNSDYYSEGMALADEFLGGGEPSTDQAPLTHEQLWRAVDSDDLSDGVRARIVGLVNAAGGVSDHVVTATQSEIEKAAATLRLRRTMLVADMFDPIRSDAETMIDNELMQLGAIMPELLAAQRAAVEQQQLIANTMTEVHKIQMEGAQTRQEIRNDVWASQVSQNDDYMAKMRAQNDARHKTFMESLRGSRY